MNQSLPGIYLYHLPSDNLPPEQFERIISASLAWSRICREYEFDDRPTTGRYLINMREAHPLQRRTGSHGTREKDKLEKMVFAGEIVMLSNLYGPANLFHINNEGKLICTDTMSFRPEGAKKIIAHYDQSVRKRDYRTTNGKPRTTQIRHLKSATHTQPERSILTRAADESGRVLSAKWHSLTDSAKTLWEATPFTHDKATTEAARNRIAESAIGTLEGLTTLMGPSPEEYMAGALNPELAALNTTRQHNQQAAVQAIHDNTKKAVTDAYDRNGLAGATAMIATVAATELAGTKGTGALGKINKLENIAAKDLKVVEINSGAKGSWNKSLNKPEPNTIYKVDGNKVYRTDERGRVAMVEADLTSITKDRNTYQQRKAGKSGDPGDEGGHLLASIFDGPGEKLNLVPMDANLNKGVWKQMENSWAKALDDGKQISVKIEPVYGGNDVRPDSFNIIYTIDGERPREQTFINAPGGK